MQNLEEALRSAAEKGLTHFALYPTPSQDGKKLYWRATATPSTGHHYIAVSHEDPIAAATQVLTNLPSARRRKAPTKETATATVTETPPEDAHP